MAKETLLKFNGETEAERGSSLPIVDGGETVGVALRTQDKVQPVFVSIGHKINLNTAIQVILSLSEGGYRIPEPLRRADQAARAYAKGEKYQMTIF
jgi:deoxyribonuclease V